MPSPVHLACQSFRHTFLLPLSIYSFISCWNSLQSLRIHSPKPRFPHLHLRVASWPCGSDSKESACNAEDPASISGLEDPLEKRMATYSSVLAWRIPWTEEPGGLMGSQRVGHNWAINTFTFWSNRKMTHVLMVGDQQDSLLNSNCTS